ncbi:hypothetical protein EV126DRAFT_43014 [Verticillium dahliae]|nr:hypothetical protein EV126DRAFT_43014 [Verticillium dahliae]
MPKLPATVAAWLLAAVGKIQSLITSAVRCMPFDLDTSLDTVMKSKRPASSVDGFTCCSVRAASRPLSGRGRNSILAMSQEWAVHLQ